MTSLPTPNIAPDEIARKRQKIASTLMDKHYAIKPIRVNGVTIRYGVEPLIRRLGSDFK